MSFYVTDGTDTILVFRAGTKVEIGDEVSVNGTVTVYNSVNQIAQGATVTITGGGTETPPATAHTTIAGALAGAEGDTATFSGTVSEIYYAWSDTYNNMSFYVTDGTDTILVFRAGTKVEIGDAVTVDGTVTAYNGVNQIAQGATVTVTEKHVCSEYTEATCKTPATCTVCGEAKDDVLATTHSYGDDHRCTVCGGVEPGYEDQVSAQVSTSISFADTTARTSLSTDAQVWTKDSVTFTNDKAASTQNIADYSNPLRLYANTSVTIACENMVSISIVINSGKPAANLTDSLTAAGLTYTVEGNVCTITFAEPTNSVTFSLVAQARIDSVTVTYNS